MSTSRSAGADRAPATTSELVGVPFIPPALLTTATTRLRAGMARCTSGIAPPPVQILESLFGILEHRVLVALCSAGVPEALTRPTTPADLARAWVLLSRHQQGR